MRSRVTAGFRRSYAELPSETQRAAERAFERVQRNPRHPSLQLKRVHTARSIVSARITDQYRALGLASEDEIAWFWIAPHHVYDKILKRL